MQITLPTLDTEQSDALAQLVSEYNAAAKSTLSAEEYCALVLLGSINARKMSNINARGRQLIEAAKSLLLSGAEWMDTLWSAGSTCSIFVVYKNSGTTNGRWVSGTNNWLIGPYSFNYGYYSGTAFAGGSTSSNSNTTMRLHCAVQTSGGGQHWLNGVSQGTVGSAGAPGIISAPGTYLSGGELGSGHIYEVIGYDSALSTGDREDVEDYLRTKYGL